MTAPAENAAIGLWRFSLAIYARPGVAPLCLDLQSRHDADVNVVLCALWFGATGRGRLVDDDIAALDAEVAALRDAVVKPLRRARTWLKGELDRDPALAALRETIKRTELDAEREEQRILEAWAAAWSRPSSSSAAADAMHNVTRYLAWRDEKGHAASPPDLRAFADGLADWDAK